MTYLRLTFPLITAGANFFIATRSVVSLHLLLLLGLPRAALQEVAPEQAVEQHDVHDGHDGHAHTAQRVGQQWHLVPVEHQPAGHPGQRVDPEHHVRAQVDDAVDAVQRSLGHVGHAEQLPQVEEDRVELHQQRHHGKAHVATRQHRQAEAGDHLRKHRGRREVQLLLTKFSTGEYRVEVRLIDW